MTLPDSFRSLTSKLESIVLSEDKGHLDHPEDLVFLQGLTGANQALSAIQSGIKSPQNFTIKWDGYPALIFGRGTNGKFSIMDKHMFNKEDGTGRQIYSPKQFIKYDMDRGVERSGLHELIQEIWPGLDAETKGAKGYYWGDLLFNKPLKDVKGDYTFKANPNGITYKVSTDSEIGKLFKNKVAGIAVHQYLDPDAPEKAAQMSTPSRKVFPTDLAKSLNGTLGALKNNTDVALVPSAMPNTPKLKINTKLLKDAQSTIRKYGNSADKFMKNAPQAASAFSQLFTTYINKKIVSGDLNNLYDDFITYFENKPMTASMRKKLTDYININKESLAGLFTIWISLYNLKNDVVSQLHKAAESSPVQGYLQDGTPSQEGFVSQGVKFIDRLGFSRQNLAAKR
jgi:hypothetical protein